MARKSAAALSVVAGSIDGRPAAPKDLTPFQREVWERTVGGEAASFFRTPALQQLLKEYCRHVEASDKLAKLIDAYGEDDLRDEEKLPKYAWLLEKRDRETKAMADKATKLRLTNQSRYTPQAAATASKNATPRKPWELAG